MQLGAIQSKCEHVANVLLPPKVAQKMLTLFLAKGVHATTAIEGNTLTEEQVRQRIVKPTPPPKSKEYLVREIDNIVAACRMIADQVLNDPDDLSLTPYQISRFNELVLAGLPLEEGAIPGRIRQYSVGVADYRGAPHEDCEYLLQRLCQWINDIRSPQPDQGIGFAVLKAILAHLYIAWIHPFGDGNGRTARLIEFQILLAAGVPNIAAHLLSNHYNQTRAEYYRQLSRASKSEGDVIPFVQYAVQGFVEGLETQIGDIRKHLRQMTWRDFVYDQFRKDKSVAANRQRHLALELGARPDKFLTRAQIRQLSPELAELYAGKTDKTISRDLHVLIKRRMIVRSGQLFNANVTLLENFLPRRRKQRSAPKSSESSET